VAPPAADYKVDAALVSRLLSAQFPDLGQLPLTHLDSGFDNEMFRLGDDLLVRLPRRAIAAQLLRNEQRCLPALAPHLPLPIPAPLHVGRSMFGYPCSFSVLPWLAGAAADLRYPDSDQASVLGRFLQVLHAQVDIAQVDIDAWPAIEQAPENAVRGVPLAHRDAAVTERLERLKTLSAAQLPVAVIQQLWQAALAAPVAARSVWLHGDLHARNVLVKDGKLAAIIDWGDITAGDAATDLASFWMLFADASARAEGLSCYGATEDLVTRAKGWACSFATLLLDSSIAHDGTVEHQRHYEMGCVTFANLLAAE